VRPYLENTQNRAGRVAQVVEPSKSEALSSNSNTAKKGKSHGELIQLGNRKEG
jgi:hypothetical protein